MKQRWNTLKIKSNNADRQNTEIYFCIFEKPKFEQLQMCLFVLTCNSEKTQMIKIHGN